MFIFWVWRQNLLYKVMFWFALLTVRNVVGRILFSLRIPILFIKNRTTRKQSRGSVTLFKCFLVVVNCRSFEDTRKCRYHVIVYVEVLTDRTPARDTNTNTTVVEIRSSSSLDDFRSLRHPWRGILSWNVSFCKYRVDLRCWTCPLPLRVVRDV